MLFPKAHLWSAVPIPDDDGILQDTSIVLSDYLVDNVPLLGARHGGELKEFCSFAIAAMDWPAGDLELETAQL